MMHEQKIESANAPPYNVDHMQKSSAPGNDEPPSYPRNGAKFDGYQNLGFVTLGKPTLMDTISTI
jgi:hypothetical protein